MSDYTRYLRPEVLIRISRLEMRARKVVEGFLSGRHRSPFHGFSVEFATHREYVPGDDTRHIDWRVYARADRYFIKQYEEETNVRAYILLDCSGSMGYPEQRRGQRMTKFDYAATVAASLAYLLVHQQDAPGLILFDHEVRDHLPPRSNPAQLRNLIDVMDRAKPDGPTEIKMLLGQLAERIKQRSFVILVSDLLADPDEIVRGLEHFSYNGHDVLVLHVLDQDELTFDFKENILFEGIEDASFEMLTDPQSLRQSYLDALHTFLTRIQSACVNHQIDYVRMSTTDSLAVALSAFLARRSHTIKR